MEIKSKHLIHIGFPKAGSTFLQEWFKEHPDFKFKNSGIAGFSNLYDLVNESGNPGVDNFKYFVTSYEGIAIPHQGAGRIWKKENEYVDKTPLELKKNQQRLCAILKNVIPEAKILVITRGYREFIRSLFSQLIRAGRLLNFDQMEDPNTHEGYGEYFNYDEILQLYSDSFGKENIIVLPYELLKDDKDAFIKLIEDKLGVTHYNVVPGVVNPSLTKQQMFWYIKLSKIVGKVLKLGGERFYNKCYEKYAMSLYFGKFDSMIKIMSMIFPNKYFQPKIPDQVLRHAFKGESLKENPLFHKYSKEYLFD